MSDQQTLEYLMAEVTRLREREAQLNDTLAQTEQACDNGWGTAGRNLIRAEAAEALAARLEEALRLFVPTGVEGGYVLLTKDDVDRVDTALAHEEEA